MNITKYVRCAFGLALAGLVLPAWGQTKSVDEKFPLLELGTAVYTNVTVTTVSPDTVCFMHSRGIGTAKVADLPDDAKERLGYKVAVKSGGADFSAQMKKTFSNVDLSSVEKAWTDAAAKNFSGGAPPGTVIAIILGIFFAFYLFFCYCTKLICDKTGNPGGLLVWLPVLQWFPMFRAAGMSPLWFLGLLLPLVNTVTLIVWAVKITRARGKHGIIALLLILPVTNLFAYLYLAFSDGKPKDEEETPKRKRQVEIMTLETA